MVSLVTPRAVAPPLSPPVHGSTHGGAYPLGTATLPVVVSQFGPQSTVLPSACAWSKVSGAVPLPLAGPGAGDAARAAPRPAAHTAAASTMQTAARPRAMRSWSHVRGPLPGQVVPRKARETAGSC